MKKLKLEINDNLSDVFTTAGKSVIGDPKKGIIMVTPKIDENYWIFRVKVSEKQAIVGFPKFYTCGIGFTVEDDCNTNLPYSSDTMDIYNHIKRNKHVEGDVHITDRRCIEAVEMIQKAATEYKDAWKNM